MFFLLRLLFWFALVLYFLPLGGGMSRNGQNQVDALEAASAAQKAVQDLVGICERNPDVCVTGKAALQQASERVRHNARVALDTLDQQMEPNAADPEAPRPEAPVVPIPTPRP